MGNCILLVYAVPRGIQTLLSTNLLYFLLSLIGGASLGERLLEKGSLEAIHYVGNVLKTLVSGWVNRFANAGDTAVEIAGNTAFRVRVLLFKYPVASVNIDSSC